MYSQYMATAPPVPLENDTPKLNGIKKVESNKYNNGLVPQASTETNSSDDINPAIDKVFTIDSQMSKIEQKTRDNEVSMSMSNQSVLPDNGNLPKSGENDKVDLPLVLRSKRNILEPIKRDVPVWSLAKGPSVVAMHLKASTSLTEGKINLTMLLFIVNLSNNFS